MNIYNFFVSPDIVSHCKKIGYRFDPLEMAIIVALSKKTIKEKHEAWNEIISSYPDMPIHGSMNFKARVSLHGYLKEIISFEEDALKDFLMSDGKEDYRFTAFWDDDELGKYDNCFQGCFTNTSFGDAWAEFSKYWLYANNKMIYVMFAKKKKMIDEDTKSLVYINCKGEIYRVENSAYNSIDRLEQIFFHLPVPFEKGDVVEFYDGEIGVLDNIPHQNPRFSCEDYVSDKNVDGSDMLLKCYRINKNGRIVYDCYPGSCLHTLRYFRGELQGQERFLKYLSQFIKNKNERIDWLINVFCKLKAETESEETIGFFDQFYASRQER